MRKIIAFLIGFVLGICIVMANADESKGISKICDDIGYLSTSCKEVPVLPLEYKDKEVAKEKAKQQITNNNTNITLDIDKIKNTMKESKQKDDVIIKTWFE